MWHDANSTTKTGVCLRVKQQIYPYFFSKNIAEQSLRTKTLKKTIFVIFLFNIYLVKVAEIINESNFGFWKSIKWFADTPQLTFILHRISSWDFQICRCCVRSTVPVGRIPGPGMSWAYRRGIPPSTPQSTVKAWCKHWFQVSIWKMKARAVWSLDNDCN